MKIPKCKIPFCTYFEAADELNDQTQFSYWLYNEARGWKWLASGAHKRSMTNPEFPGWILKVYREMNGHTKDAAFWNSVPEELKPYWLPYRYTCRFFVVQPRANTRLKQRALDIIRAQIPGANWKYDIGRNNVGYYNRKPVIFDFSYDPLKPKKKVC